MRKKVTHLANVAFRVPFLTVGRRFIFIFLALGLSSSSVLGQTTYYSQGTGDFGTLSNWNSDPGGTGSNPISIGASDNFVVQSPDVIVIEANYAINDATVENGGTLRFEDGSGSVTFTVNGSLDVDGVMDATSSGSFALHSLDLSGDFTGSGDLSFFNDDDGLSAVALDFNGSGAQDFTVSGSTIILYQVVVSNTAGTVTMTNSDYTVKNTFTIDSGASVVLGSGTATHEHNLIINTTAANFDALTNSSILQFIGSSNRSIQVVDDLDFNSITVNKTGGSFTLQGSSNTFTINGTLRRTQGSITLSSATLAYTGGATLFYSGSTSQSTGVEWTSTLNPDNLTINNSSGVIITGAGAAGDREIDGDFTLTTGELIHSESGRTLTIHGDIIGGSGAYGVTTRGTIVLNGSSASNITISESFNVGNLTVNKTSSSVLVTLVGGSILDMDKGTGTDDSDFSITQGTFVYSSTSQLNHSGTSSGSHNLIMGANGKVQTGGTDVSGFDSYTFDPASEFIYNGAVNEIIETSITYGNLTISKSAGVAEFESGGGTVTLGSGSDITINSGTLRFNDAVLSHNSNALTIASGAILETNGTDITGFSTFSVSGTLRFNGLVSPETVPAGISTAASITVNNANGLSLAADLTITGTLTLTNGLLTGSGNTLTTASGATISGASAARYISGALLRTYSATGSLEFPVGDATAYRPVSINVTSGSGTVTAQYATGSPGIGNTPSGIKTVSTNRLWTISAGAGVALFNVGLIYTEPGFTIGTEGQMRVIRGNNGDTNWVDADSNPTIDQGIDKVTAAGLDATSSLTSYSVAEAQGSFLWDGGGDGSTWSDASNWDADAQPKAGDIVILDATTVTGNYTVTYDASATTSELESIVIRPDASQTIGLVLTRSVILNLTATGSALDLDDVNGGTPELTYNGSSLVMGGSAYDGGLTAIDVGSTVSYSAGSTVNADSYGSLVINASSGTLTASANVTVNGNFEKSGASTFSISNGSLTVTGTADISAGSVTTSGTGGFLLNGAATVAGSIVLNGSASSTFGNTLANDGTLTFNTGAGTVTVSGIYTGTGTMTAAGGTPAVVFNSAFNPSGNVTFGSQSVTLNGNVNIAAGTFTPSSNSTFAGNSFQVSGSGALSSSSGKITFAGTGGQSIISAVTFNDLTVNNTGSGITLSAGSPVVSGVLTLTDGIVATGANTLVLGSAATVSGGSDASYVEGNLANTYTFSEATRAYPLGSGGFFRQLKLIGRTTTVATTSVLTASLSEQDAATVSGTLDTNLERVSEVRFYDVANNGNALQISTIVDFRVNDDDLVGDLNPNTTLRLATALGDAGSGDMWDERNLLNAPNTTSLPVDIRSVSFTENLTASGANSTLYVALATTAIVDNPLPVELSVFEVTPSFGKNVLTWSTASEVNNEGFIIFRAPSEAGPFVQINEEFIPGFGNSNTRNDYSYDDLNVEHGTMYYYQISSRDFDGTIHQYGEIRSAAPLELPEAFELSQNYPNPFNPSTTLSFTIASAGRATLEVYNILGQKIATIFDSEYFEPGAYSGFTWNARDDYDNAVSTGVYYLLFTAEGGKFSQVRKMVYLR